MIKKHLSITNISFGYKFRFYLCNDTSNNEFSTLGIMKNRMLHICEYVALLYAKNCGLPRRNIEKAWITKLKHFYQTCSAKIFDSHVVKCTYNHAIVFLYTYSIFYGIFCHEGGFQIIKITCGRRDFR